MADYKDIAKAISDPENQPHQWDDEALQGMFIDAIDKIERLREALSADNQTIRLHLGEMTQQEMRTVKAAFSWVLSYASLTGRK